MGSCVSKPSNRRGSADSSAEATFTRKPADSNHHPAGGSADSSPPVVRRDSRRVGEGPLARRPCKTRPLPRIYVAKQAYVGGRIDEISFAAGDKFVIKTEDPSSLAGRWCEGRRKSDYARGRIFFDHFQPIEEITQKLWYVGRVTSGGAESMLQMAGNHTGYFLVRYRRLDATRTQKHPYADYALSVRIGDEPNPQVRHFLIQQTEDGEYFLEYGRSCETVEELIQLYSRRDGPRNNSENPPWIDSGYPRPPQLIAPCLRFEATLKEPDFGELRNSFEIPRESVRITQRQGASRFGCETYHARWRDGPVRLVVKLFPAESVKENLLPEAKKLAELRHATLVKLFGICHTPDDHQSPTLLVMEYCPDGTLLDYLKRRYDDAEPPQVRDVVEMANQIAEGMAFLEQQSITHGDLAARNILMDRNNVKISDTALYKIVANKRYAESTDMLRWTAPEAMTERGQKLSGLLTNKSDVWAFGIVLVEIIQAGKIPYAGKDDQAVLFDVKSGKLLKKPDGCDETLFGMIKGCWNWNPDDRSTFQELKWNLDGFFHQGKNLYGTNSRKPS